MSIRHTRAEQDRMDAAGRELVRAEQDYERLRLAYLTLARDEAGNEVAISMVGADMDRAHAALQLLAGQRQLPFASAPAPAMRSPSRRMAEVDS
ncbi:MAG: hypothetical protein LH617_12155 [Ramlibacter sp.]|nr:hypothetical protein [Ramlibacter sp.]